jgi:hypothetical protein
MEEMRSYYAIIPANVRYDDELPANAKLLYGEITALCNEKGYCWAGNEYFAKLYNVSKTSISKWIAALIARGYITSEIIYKEGTKQILNRYIRIVTYPIEEKLNTPIEEKLKDNNTYINNTINNTSKKESKKEKTYDEIISSYVQDEELKNALLEFIKMRKLIKKPLTNNALELLIKKLFNMTNSINEMVAILEQSIMNNWQSIYPLKQDTYSNKKSVKDNDGWAYIDDEIDRIIQEKHKNDLF